MIAHVQWPLCLPFPHVHLFYVTPPALIRGHLRSQFLSFLCHGNVVTSGAVSYGSVICLYVEQVIALQKLLAEV